MKRKIIHIDEAKCNGCGLCVDACHEGALRLVGGKARLVSESYCDGLGDCLPECPQGAITLEERESAPYDEEAVKKHIAAKEAIEPACGCAAAQARTIERERAESPAELERRDSRLGQWPCQIKLVPVNAPYFAGAKLLIAADCTAFAYANLHADFMRGKITLIGCPKLDGVDYSEKLTEIIKNNDIQSVTIVRMEVPCCGGLESAAKTALQRSGKFMPWQVVTIATDGRILDR